MRLAIVGAGVAGATVAGRLAAAGMEVDVFDKARGAGGRTATRRTEHGDFDHGAQYFTARAPAFQARVTDWMERGVAARWHGSVVEVEEGIVRVEGEPSARFVGLPRMSVLARDLLGALAPQTGVRIEQLERRAGEWWLRAEGGGEHGPYGACVLAVPAPQAVPLLAAAPELAARAARARLEPCHATLVRFAAKLPVPFDAAFVRGSSLAWIARNDSKPGRSGEQCWVLHSTPAFSRASLEASPEDVAADLLRALEGALSRPLHEVRFATSHRWLYARAEASASTGPVWSGERRLGLCGDWTTGDRVEDAWLSGERLFEAIHEDLPL